MPKLKVNCKQCDIQLPKNEMFHAPYHDVYICKDCYETPQCAYTLALVDANTVVLAPKNQCLVATINDRLYTFHGTNITLARFFGLHQEENGEWYFFVDENGEPIRDPNFRSKIQEEAKTNE